MIERNWRRTVEGLTPFFVKKYGNNMVEGDLDSRTYVTGIAGWHLDRDGSSEFDNIVARGEFHANTFVLDEIVAHNGSSIWAKGAARLAVAVTTDTTFSITVEDSESGHAAFASVGDILRARDWQTTSLFDIWATVDTVTDNTTSYTYDLTKNDGTNATLGVGTAIVNYGGSGDGVIIATANITGNPYMDIRTNTATPWTNEGLFHTRTGRLDSLAAVDIIGTNEFGFAAGTDLSSASTSGQHIIISNKQVTIRNVDLVSHDGSFQTVSITSAGDLKLGTNVASTATTGLTFTAADGDLLLGQIAGNYLFWDQSAGTIAISGALSAGTIDIGGADSTSFHVDATGQMWLGNATYSGAPYKVSAGGVLVATGVTVTGGINATSGSITGPLTLTGGSIAIGTTPPTSASAGTGIWLDETGLHGLASSVEQVRIDAVTGAISAGAGSTILDVDGIRIVESGTAVDDRAITFEDSGGTIHSGLYGYQIVGDNSILMETKAVAAKDSNVEIYSRGGSGKQASIFLESFGVAGNARLYIRSMSAGLTAELVADAIDITAITSGVTLAGELDVSSNIVRNNGTGTQDIGTVGTPFDNLYVNSITATTIIGTLAGAEWEYAGNMTIDANVVSSTSTVYVVNQAAGGTANLDVENNIIVGGTVDGIDIASFAAAHDIGSDVQAWDANLDQIAALAVTNSNFIVGNGSAWVAESGATVRTSLGLGTGNTPQFTAIQLGHASDTTIARVSAGLISVEGDTVALLAATQTLTNKTLTTPTISATGFTNAQHAHAGATSGGTIDHGALTGRSDDDHTQYILATGVRVGASASSQTFTVGIIDSSLTASRLMSSDGSKKLASVANLASWVAGTTNRVTVANDGDGTITLSGPQDIHTGASPTFLRATLSQTTGTAPLTISSTTVVTNLAADHVNKTITAGVGMTGGGALTSGSGVTLTMGAPTTLTVATTNSVSGTTHSHAITNSSNPGAAASLLATDSSGFLTLVKLSTDTLSDKSGGNLTISPAGDVIFDPTGNDLLPATGYDLNIGSIQKKYLTLHAAELWVETLVAQETIATIGGRILVGPTTYLTRDMGTGDTTIYVKHNQMASGDRAYMEANGFVEFFAITSAYTEITPNEEYSYTVTRNLDASGANAWYAGDAMFNTGTTGDGFIDIYSLRSIKSATQYGPAIVGNERNSATFNDWGERWAIGNLNGVYGYGVTTYGAAFGEYASGKANITIDATNGLRLRSYTTDILQIKNTDGLGYIVGPLYLDTAGGIYQGSGTFASPTTGLKMWNSSGTGKIGGYNAGTIQWYGDTDGKLYAGAGAVMLDANGITIGVGTSAADSIQWVDGSSVAATIFATSVASVFSVFMRAQETVANETVRTAIESTSLGGSIYASLGTDWDGTSESFSYVRAYDNGSSLQASIEARYLSGLASVYISASETQITGDLQVDTDTLFVDSALGRVGIGTTAPVSELNVVGTGSSVHVLTVNATTAGGNFAKFIGDAGDPVFQFDSGGTGGEAVMRMYTDNVLTNQISARSAEYTYFNAGNVGIGTTAPGSLLELSSATATEAKITSTSTGYSPQLSFYNGATLGGFVQFRGSTVGSDPNMMKVGSYTSGGQVQIVTGAGSNAMRIDSSGNVGIGTTDPGAKLDILATYATTGYPLQVKNSGYYNAYFQGTDANKQASYYIENDRGSWASYGGFLYGGSTSTLGNVFGQTRTDKLFMFADGASNLGMWVGTMSNAPFVIGTNNLERVRITSDGNVGIGVAPSARLDVAGGFVYLDNGDFAASRGIRFRNNADTTTANGGGVYEASNDVLYIAAGAANQIIFRNAAGTNIAELTGMGGSSLMQFDGDLQVDGNTIPTGYVSNQLTVDQSISASSSWGSGYTPTTAEKTLITVTVATVAGAGGLTETGVWTATTHGTTSGNWFAEQVSGGTSHHTVTFNTSTREIKVNNTNVSNTLYFTVSFLRLA